jgi:Protein of unknown function (DUF1360)
MASHRSAGVAGAASVTALVEDALAAWRVVRLVRSDYLTQPIRDRVYDLLDGDAVGEDDHIGTCVCRHAKEQHVRVADEAPHRCHHPGCPCGRYRPIASARVARLRHPKLATLLECPYCLGVWAAGAVLVARALHANWIVRLLAVSAVASELATREH